MPAAARPKLCSSVSAWVYLPVSLASVIVFAGYVLLLFFVSSKPFSLIFINRCSKHIIETDDKEVWS